MRQNNLHQPEVLRQLPTLGRRLHRKVEELLLDSLQQEAPIVAVEATIHVALLQEVMVEADK